MPPCLCDLTYLVDHLEQLAFRCAEDLKIAIVQPMDLHSIASHVESVIKEIAGRPSSLLRNDVWTGESWRDEFRELARSMEGLLYKYVRTKAVDFELVPDWRGLLDIATAAQLLEESWYHISNAESPMNNFRLFSEVADDGAETGMVDSASTKLIVSRSKLAGNLSLIFLSRRGRTTNATNSSSHWNAFASLPCMTLPIRTRGTIWPLFDSFSPTMTTSLSSN